MTKKLSQFGHNVRKYELVSAVAENFNTNCNIRQINKIFQQRKQAGGFINRQYFERVSLFHKSIGLYP